MFYLFKQNKEYHESSGLDQKFGLPDGEEELGEYTLIEAASFEGANELFKVACEPYIDWENRYLKKQGKERLNEEEFFSCWHRPIETHENIYMALGTFEAKDVSIHFLSGVKENISII